MKNVNQVHVKKEKKSTMEITSEIRVNIVSYLLNGNKFGIVLRCGFIQAMGDVIVK